MESEEVVSSEVRQSGRKVVDISQRKVSAAQVDREVPTRGLKVKGQFNDRSQFISVTVILSREAAQSAKDA